MNTLCVIPARGGSKGIRRKNIISLAGKPLIAHTIEAAHKVETINRIIVSTDDAEIAAISRRYGTEVIERPAEISGDTASSESALLHALEHLESKERYRPDILVFLQCTSPLMEPEDIQGTIDALLNRDADSSFAAAPFHRFLWQYREDVAVGINHDKTFRLRRQDLVPQFVEAGVAFAMKTEGFLQAKHRFFGKTVMHVLPPDNALEIDEPIDLQIAEVLLRNRYRDRKRKQLPAAVEGVVFDFDGVFTDNKVYVEQDGTETVRCDRGDGYGVGLLRTEGIPMLVLSTEKNPVVAARCKKLGLEYRQGLDNKLSEFNRWITEHKLDIAGVLFVGNDINDRECLIAAGCAVCPADAHPDILPLSRIILESGGGNGAVRELADMILSARTGKN